MTTLKGELTTNAGQEALNEGVDTDCLSDEALRHARACTNLGKMAKAGEVVVDFRVEGRQSFCSPVRGIIFASIENSAGADLGERVLQTTNYREAPSDPSIHDYLNELADKDRTSRVQLKSFEPTWEHDK